MVVAGGSGRRFGGPKQYAALRGRPVLAWSVDAARTVAEGIVVVVPADGAGHPDAGMAGLAVDAVVTGGASRSDSVRAGLAAVPADARVVVVHDAARPLATAALFRRVVEAVDAADGPAAAVPGLPVADTVKRVADGRVVATVPRDDLVTVQTPQAFRADALRAAHAGGGTATDDAGLVEALGLAVAVVPGEQANLKVTTPTDLVLADLLVAP